MGTRSRATPEEIAEAGAGSPGVRSKATPEEIAEAAPRKEPDFLDRELAAKQREEPHMWGMLSSAMEYPSLGLGPPLAGATNAFAENVKGMAKGQPLGWDELVKAYRAGRDPVAAGQRQNVKDYPVSSVLGAVLTSPGSAPTIPGRLALAGGQGLLYGAASSKGDLTKGEVADVGKDALISGGTNLAGAAAGEVIGAGTRALGNKLGSVLSKNEAAAQAAADKVFNSARGALGGETSSASRTLELLEKAATDHSLPEDISRQAAEMLAGPEGQALKAQVVRSSLGRFPDQLGRIQSARDAMVDAAARTEAPAVQAAANARLNDSSHLTRRLRELLPKILLPAIGGALGGAPGAGAGALTSAVLGRSGTTVKNALTDPYVSSRLLGLSTGALEGASQAATRSSVPLAEWSQFINKPEDEGSE